MVCFSEESLKSPQILSALLRVQAFCCLALCHLPVNTLTAANRDSFFVEKVAPIFSRHCLRCHDGSGDNDVRLITGGDLFEHGWVVPGDFEASGLGKLVSGQSRDEIRMPPEGDALDDSELAVLREWIMSGASWPEGYQIAVLGRGDTSWWAFQPIHSPAADSIDDFIRLRLSEKGLRLSPEADRITLIRRLSHDLLGLPPTPEQVNEFLADNDPDAWARLVDRMLDSPHYGERYATHWLDLAHYADTHGFERDQRRPNAWRYRDYVVDALNEDKSYDRFLQEQLAGDILWPDDQDAVVATGFLAAGPWDFVGQVETKSPQLRRATRTLDLDDIVSQVMTSTVGMTVHCARCHDHKLDPIGQEEYYQLQAVFSGVTRGDRIISQEALRHYQSELTRLTESKRNVSYEIARLKGEGLSLADIVGGGDGLGSGVYRSGIDPRTAKVQTRDFGSLGNVVNNQFQLSEYQLVDGVLIPNGDGSETEIVVSSEGTVVSGLPKTSGQAWDVIRNGPVASQHSPSLGGVDFTSAGHDLLGIHANAAITFDLREFRSAIGQDRLVFQSDVGYFGAQGDYHADVSVALDGNIVWSFDGLKREHGLQQLSIEIESTASFLTLIATDGGNGYSHDQVGFGDAKILRKVVVDRSEADARKLHDLEKTLATVKQELDALGPPPRVYGVVAKTEPDLIHRLKRGDAEMPVGEPVSPGSLRCVTSLEAGFGTAETPEGDRRVALANWITHPQNPLTYRVIANRVWSWHFGKGLVSTPSDFGTGGSTPTHPELLDWLALQLRNAGGSLKDLHRIILNSQTYRQQSRHESGQFAVGVDADNDFLWRQNSRRLTAEAIRDSVLAVSGKLNLKSGGPGFEDFSYTEAYAPIYRYVVADQPELWRRSVYRYVVRTTPNEFLTTFDCPDPASFTPRRLTTTTPLQSLALLNNEFLIRQSDYFAKRVFAEVGEEISDQVIRCFLLAYSRKPNASELEISKHFVEEHGLFAFCRVILNSSEFLYID